MRLGPEEPGTGYAMAFLQSVIRFVLRRYQSCRGKAIADDRVRDSCFVEARRRRFALHLVLRSFRIEGDRRWTGSLADSGQGLV